MDLSIIKIPKVYGLNKKIHNDIVFRMETSDLFRKALETFVKGPSKKISQKALADAMGISAKQVNDFLGKRCNWSEAKRVQASEILNKDYFQMLELGQKLIGEKTSLEEASYIDHFKPQKPSEIRQQPLDYERQPSEKNNNKNRPKVLPLEHGNLVKAFINQEAGYEINKALIEIERLDAEEFDRIRDFVRFSLDRVRSKKIADQNSE